MRLVITTAAFAVMSCAANDPPAQASIMEVRPGDGVGAIRIGMRYRDVRAALGDAESLANQRLGFARYPKHGLEVVLTTPTPDRLTDDARVIAIGARAPGSFGGSVVPSARRQAIEAALGVPQRAGEYDYFASGAAVRYASPDADEAIAVAVFAAWKDAPEPPPMVPLGAKP